MQIVARLMTFVDCEILLMRRLCALRVLTLTAENHIKK